MKLIKVFENDNFIIDYDKDNKKYRVSYFEDYHFKEECWFDEYEEEDKTLQSAVNYLEDFGIKVQTEYGYYRNTYDILRDLGEYLSKNNK